MINKGVEFCSLSTLLTGCARRPATITRWSLVLRLVRPQSPYLVRIWRTRQGPMVQDPEVFRGADSGACLTRSNSGMFHGGPVSLQKRLNCSQYSEITQNPVISSRIEDCLIKFKELCVCWIGMWTLDRQSISGSAMLTRIMLHSRWFCNIKISWLPRAGPMIRMLTLTASCTYGSALTRFNSSWSRLAQCSNSSSNDPSTPGMYTLSI